MIRVLAPLFFSANLFAALPTQQEALNLAFPGASFARREHFLTEAQGKEIQNVAGTSLSGLWNVAYEARKEGKLIGVAFFDTHRVRTLNETAMIALSQEGKVIRVEVVAFREPQDYMAKQAWVRQFEGKKLDPDLSLERNIRPLSGATLTAHALTDAARRALALWRVLYGSAS
jgi:Na+-translocating ferredoxin:NAD+ oxidoreductase RnfG subunit